MDCGPTLPFLSAICCQKTLTKQDLFAASPFPGGWKPIENFVKKCLRTHEGEGKTFSSYGLKKATESRLVLVL